MAALQWKIGPSSSSVRLLPNSHPASSVKLSTSSCIVNMATYARPFFQSRRGNIKKLKTKPNSLPILKKMHVKLGDPVKVISGHDKGKIGEVISINKKEGTIIVKDVNMKTKHVAGRQEGESGQIVQVEGPIHSSNVMLYSNTQNVASRVGHKILEDGTKVRYLLKTGEVIDNPENWKRVLKEQKEDKKEK